MPTSFTIKNGTGVNSLEVRVQGGGPPRESSLAPGEEGTFEIGEDSKATISQGVPTAQPKR